MFKYERKSVLGNGVWKKMEGVFMVAPGPGTSAAPPRGGAFIVTDNAVWIHHRDTPHSFNALV